ISYSLNFRVFILIVPGKPDETETSPLSPPSKTKIESLYQGVFVDTVKFLIKENCFE
ncbi:PNPLA4 isoform 1, partial [Pan troglodytes]